jgi:hypothetical protein
MKLPEQKTLKHCFATAAFGQTYRRLAKLLAADLEQYALSFPLVIVTDSPKDFQNHPNVIVFKHWQRGVQAYHERRFAINYALHYSDTVIYFDADVRLCGPFPTDLTFLPGLTARASCDLSKHLTKHPLSQRKQEIVDKMAEKVGLSLTNPDLKFINEFLFVIKADQGREQDFLRLWGELAIYADTLGLHKHPTYAMTLAAVKTNFPVFRSEMEGLDFFDDRNEKYNIKRGKSQPEDKKTYFQAQYEIEQQERTLLRRIQKKILNPLKTRYHLTRVQQTYLLDSSKLVNYPSLSAQISSVKLR